ncbi:MAG: S-layer homology domain-containing protein [Firmicutes bacterium]|nr:S-layer homology domain-containing protein [Bacillota bacterium]
MRNLKKTLVALLVLSMVLAGFTGVAGAAFSDTAGNKAANKIEKLAALGVLAGYPDGTFKPDNNITRAEFAKIACVLAGLKSSGDILKNSPSKFSDVKAGEWYTGWVNLAVSQGYMKGYPDGTFKPQANISNAEVLTVLCRLLGYNDNLPGDWPIEYLVKAADLDISDGVTFDSSAPATRGIVAWFAEQSLEVEKHEWDKDREKFVKITPVETILSEAFEGALKEDALCKGWEIRGDKWYITVYPGNDDGGFSATTADVPVNKSVVLNGVAHYSSLENKIIDYITNTDGEIIYAEVKNYGSLSDTEAKVVSDSKFEINDKSYTVNSAALSKIAGTWATYASVTDGTVLDDTKYQKVYTLLNEDGEIAYVRTSEGSTPGIVDTVNATTKKISFKDGAYGNQSLTNFNNKVGLSSTTYIVFRNGALADVKDIKPGDFLWVYEGSSANGYDFKLSARDSKVSGKLEEHNVGLTSFTINGTSYNGWRGGTTARLLLLSTDGGDSFVEVNSSDLGDVLGNTVTAMTDGDGYIRAIISDVESYENAMYGVVSEVFGSTSSAGYSTTDIEIFTKDGALHKYPVNSDSAKLAKARRETASPNRVFFDVGDDAWNSGTLAWEFESGDINAAAKPLVRFTLQSNGAIDNFEILGHLTSPATWTISDGDTDLNYIKMNGTSWAAGNAVVFDVSASDPDDWEVVTAKDLIDAADALTAPATIDVVGYKQSDGEITYIAVNEAVASDATYSMVMSKGYDADGPYVKILSSSGTTVKKPMKSGLDGASYDWAGLAKGDVISYKMSGGTVTWYDEIDQGTAAKVYSVKSSGTKRIAIGASDAWYYVDDDTQYWSWTDTSKDPIAITFGEVQALDWVKFYTGATPAAGQTLKFLVVSPAP